MAQAHLEAVRAALADRYQIEREVGHGGTAIVFLANDPRFSRQVAIKVLRPEWKVAVGPERFLLEIRLTAQLSHPHILPLLDSDERGGFLYYVMPYVSGESLRQRLRRERQLPIEEAIRIAREIAEALAVAHARGIVHRDIKPENILLQGGHAIVADFGFAKALSEAGADAVSSSGLRVGTPGYMSPEQAAGEASPDQRSDVYGLACVAYEMLAGEPPFTGPTAQMILAKQLSHRVPRLRVLRETVPAAMDAAFAKALARVPADRYATAEGFVAALARSVAARPRRRVIRFGIAAGAVVVGIVSLRGWVLHTAGDRPPATAAGIPSSDAVRLGVLPLSPPAVDPNASDEGRLVQYLFVSELAKYRGLAVADPFSLNSRLATRREQAETEQLGALRDWGLQYVVRLTVTSGREGREVSYVLSDTRRGDVAAAGTIVDTSRAGLPAEVREASKRLLDALDAATGGIAKRLDIAPFLGTPNSASVGAFLQGIEYAYRGEAGGRGFFERAVAFDHDFIAPRVFLVSELARTGDTAAASVQVAVLDSLKPTATPFEQALIGWCEAVVRGDLEAKVRHLRIGLSYSPGNNLLLYNLAYTLWALGRPEEAVPPLREAIASGWRFGSLYTLWGVVAIETGALHGLRGMLERARSITPRDPYLSGLLEALALFEGDTVAAQEYGSSFRADLGGARVARGYADMVPVYRSLAEHARERHDGVVAARLLQRAVDADSAQPLLRLDLARVQAEAGDGKAAERNFEAAAAAGRLAPEVVYRLGVVAELLGRQADARRYFQTYLQSFPNGVEAVLARERLRALEMPSGRP